MKLSEDSQRIMCFFHRAALPATMDLIGWTKNQAQGRKVPDQNKREDMKSSEGVMLYVNGHKKEWIHRKKLASERS